MRKRLVKKIITNSIDAIKKGHPIHLYFVSRPGSNEMVSISVRWKLQKHRIDADLAIKIKEATDSLKGGPRWLATSSAE